MKDLFNDNADNVSSNHSEIFAWVYAWKLILHRPIVWDWEEGESERVSQSPSEAIGQISHISLSAVKQFTFREEMLLDFSNCFICNGLSTYIMVEKPQKIRSIRPKVTLNNPWHPYLTRFGLNFPKLPLIIRPTPLVCCKLTEQGLDWLTSGFFWPKIIWRRRPTRNWQLPPSSPALQSSGGEFLGNG